MMKNPFSSFKHHRGVTLLEVLLVTSIIAIASIGMVIFIRSYSQHILIKHTQKNLRHISNVAVLYHLHHAAWPQDFQALIDAGLLSPQDQCSPWTSITPSTTSTCANTQRIAYSIDVGDHTNQFLVSLSLNDTTLLNTIAENLPHTHITNNRLTLYTPTPEQAAAADDNGVFRLIGFSDYRSNNREGNGVTLPMNYPTPCPKNSVPVVFHAAYQFTCPQSKALNPFDLWDGPCYLAMKFVDQLAYPIGGTQHTIDNPPNEVKLCVKTTLDPAGQAISAYDGYRHSRERFFTVCLNKNKVAGDHAPPYDTYNQAGGNTLDESTRWCRKM